jgi:hypothetical protein
VSACLHEGGRVKVYKRKTLHSASVVFGMIRICAAVQAWLEFSGHFLNLLKIQTCFFNKPDEVYGNKDRL